MKILKILTLLVMVHGVSYTQSTYVEIPTGIGLQGQLNYMYQEVDMHTYHS